MADSIPNRALPRGAKCAILEFHPLAIFPPMLTIDDVRAVPLFSTLPDAEIERLAQTSADLHLAAGEFAVHEGGDRALYAVLSGKMEVVKMFDGVKRRLGWRLP